MSTELWGVWCVVSGGVTGHREAWLKSNDTRVELATEADAEAEAKRLRDAGFGRYSSARFHYYAKRIS